MLIGIIGKCGSGKTALMSNFQRQTMLGGFSDYSKAKREIKHLQNIGYSDLEFPPQKHLCFADYDFKINKKFSRYKVSGFEIGLANKHFNTVFFPVGSSIFLDEAQRYFDSRMSMYLRKEVYGWFQLHRHNDYKIYLTAQRLANIDINIRSLFDKIIVIDDLDVKTDDYGFVTKITWTCREFECCETAEAYQLAKEKKEISKLGKVVKYTSDVNIFKYYDSHSNKLAFYNVSYTKDLKLKYDYFTECGYEFSLEGIVDFNNKNYFVAPKGYLKRQQNDVA